MNNQVTRSAADQTHAITTENGFTLAIEQSLIRPVSAITSGAAAAGKDGRVTATAGDCELAGHPSKRA
jgi:hypothetical protein